MDVQCRGNLLQRAARPLTEEVTEEADRDVEQHRAVECVRAKGGRHLAQHAMALPVDDYES